MDKEGGGGGGGEQAELMHVDWGNSAALESLLGSVCACLTL